MSKVSALLALLATVLGAAVLLAPPAQAALTGIAAGCADVTITVTQAI